MEHHVCSNEARVHLLFCKEPLRSEVVISALAEPSGRPRSRPSLGSEPLARESCLVLGTSWSFLALSSCWW